MIRNCVGCGQTDDHPRHIVDIGGVDVLWHHDCHARTTDCEVCAAVTESAGDGVTGDELRAHITQYDPGAAVVAAANASVEEN